jgi:hypothetical protein
MKQYFLFAVLSVSVVVIALAFVKKENEQPDKHLEIVLRNIGHEVLLRSKDSTSRVLPVKAIDKNTFQISFENSFGFIPDTLMHLVQQQLAKTDRPRDYTVSVKECDRNQTIFAYEVNTVKGDLKPCRGRKQKKGCYVIEISFLAKRSFNYGWLSLAIIPMALAGLYLLRRKERIDEPPTNEAKTIPVTADNKVLGNFTFFEAKGILTLNGDTIELSVKEAKALSILASNRNQVVARDLLMKKIWEEEGVVVIARNVDVLISKLRKRLSVDPSVKIVNVPGKGYKLIS